MTEPTEHDETRHLHELTPSQHRALDALIEGLTVTGAADAAGVVRQTVSGWRNHHPAFRAAFSRRQRDLRQDHTNRILSIDGAALNTVMSAIEGGDAALSMRWTQHRDLQASASSDPSDSNDIINRQVETFRRSWEQSLFEPVDDPFDGDSARIRVYGEILRKITMENR